MSRDLRVHPGTDREIVITDPQHRPLPKTWLNRFALKFIRDERDLPFVHLTLQMTFILIPLAAALYVPGVFRWWMAPIYWAILFLGFFDRYILMLHNTSHRPLYKRQFGFMKHYIPWILGPFCGETPETYYIHHITMHHAEGNLPKDLSSTMKYQRDSLSHFLIYFFDFFLLGMVRLPKYEFDKKRTRLGTMVWIGEASFWVVVGVGLYFAFLPTMTVFVVPYLLCRFLMMAGNWGQHAFVSADDPGNSYVNSLTCINGRYNRRCFNDGYHIGHHVMANRHWTEMPEDFIDQIEIYRQKKAVVFQGIDFFQVWFFLMFGMWGTLANHFVDLEETPRTREEIIAFLKSRVVAFDVTQPQILAAVPT